MLPSRPSRFGFFPLLLCGAALAILSPIFWLSTRLPEAPQPRTYENLPLYERVYPAAHYTYARLRSGEWPLWNPWQLCGTEHLADPRNAVLQPLNLIFLLLPPEAALAAHAFLCSFLMGLGFLLFLRSLDVRYVPAFLGACVYAFSGASAAALSYPEYMAFLVWLPLCFWGVRATMAGAPHATPALAIGLALAFLSGALDALLASGLVLLAYAALRSFFMRRASGERRGGGARRLRNAVLLAMLLSAGQLLPYLAWAWEHGALWPFGASGLQAALPNGLRELIQQALDVPDGGLLPPLAYAGVISLLVLPTALFHRQSKLDAFFFLAVGAVGMLLVVYGRSGWDARLPFEAFAFPASFALATAAALGADRLFETGRDPRSPNVWGPVLLVVLCGGVLFYELPALGRGIAVVFFFVLLLPSVIVRLRWVAAMGTGLAVMLVFVDLTHAMGQHVLHPYADMPAALSAHDKEIRTAQEQALLGRTIVSARPLDGSLVQNIGTLRDLRCAGGLFPALTPSQRLWWDRLREPIAGNRAVADAVVSPTAAQPRLLNHMAVRAFLSTPDGPLLARKWGEGAPRLRPALSGGTLQVFVNDDALPRAYWARAWRPADSLEAAITVITGQDFQPGRECVVQAHGAALEQLVKLVPSAPAAEKAETAACVISGDTPERVTLSVSAPAAGVTVLADTFASGWRAELDGKPVPILQVNGLFRGVATPAGEHTVVFQYRPLPFYFGLAISIFSGLITTLWGAARLFIPRAAQAR